MITHEFYRPIPPGTVRISVILGGDSFTIDIASDRLGDAVTAFEHQYSPLTPDRCMAIAAAAANDDDGHVVTSAALWLYLFQPGEGSEMHSQRLAEMIKRDGSAILTAMVCPRSGEWTFRLFAMPRWPVSAKPDRASSHTRRRWR